ncbi:hypothetical protein GCM10023219_04060 [Stakelama sediminis]|uniref:DUF465 domain-containing protein n=1 Tax=Stakelama sediminis TaxID=463200 RepID=A0A840YU90_9SPHN|nr:DUF465 domain-containing protein [Stakelama sediminis]MBB5717119.1 hypothetical protein [Stakelama sediminis]
MDEAVIRANIEQLRVAHRDLDAAIDALLLQGGADQLRLARMKRQKLRIRDEIVILEDQLFPDIIA